MTSLGSIPTHGLGENFPNRTRKGSLILDILSTGVNPIPVDCLPDGPRVLKLLSSPLGHAENKVQILVVGHAFACFFGTHVLLDRRISFHSLNVITQFLFTQSDLIKDGNLPGRRGVDLAQSGIDSVCVEIFAILEELVCKIVTRFLLPKIPNILQPPYG